MICLFSGTLEADTEQFPPERLRKDDDVLYAAGHYLRLSGRTYHGWAAIKLGTALARQAHALASGRSALPVINEFTFDREDFDRAPEDDKPTLLSPGIDYDDHTELSATALAYCSRGEDGRLVFQNTRAEDYYNTVVVPIGNLRAGTTFYGTLLFPSTSAKSRWPRLLNFRIIKRSLVGHNQVLNLDDPEFDADDQFQYEPSVATP